MKKLTIGMCTFDDYEGVFFTIQSIRLHHKNVIDNINFIVVDNNPSSTHGNEVKNFVEKSVKGKYIPFTEYSSTSIRNLIFENAETPYVLCVDCHILLENNSIERLIQFFDAGKDEGNLVQGPLLWDDLKGVSTGFNSNWGAHMQGQWNFDERYVNADSEPFEIYAQGLGLFGCRKDAWLGFNANFRGFGGEEIYLHDKYRRAGKKTLLLPFLGWNHRFVRVNGVPYTNTFNDRYRNYLIGHIELQKDANYLEDIFKDVLSEDTIENIKTDVIKLFKPVSCCGRSS